MNREVTTEKLHRFINDMVTVMDEMYSYWMYSDEKGEHICLSCGESGDATFRFCPHCGKPMENGGK